MVQGKTLKFEDGTVQFRLRLAVSLLSHRPILIRNIRSDSVTAPGLHQHEASYLRLLDRITNGSVVEINATGTQLRFKPGVLIGGELEHDCPVVGSSSSSSTAADNNDDDDDTGNAGAGRGVGWYLEGLLPLAPFGKEPLDLTLNGITDGTSAIDPSPDYIASSLVPLLTQFGVGSNGDDFPPAVKVTKRGAAPGGGGSVQFFCPVVKEIRPIDLTDVGKIKRVRGTAVSCKIPPSSAARAAHSAKGLLHRLLPDVWVHTDCHSSSKRGSGGGCGPSPGLGICLTAVTTEGVVMSAETCLDPTGTVGTARGAVLPEDLGVRAAAMLLEEIRMGGCIDSNAQSTALLFMCLGPEDVARIRVGTLSQYAVESLRLFRKVFGIEFKVKADAESRTVLLSCLGSGYRNMAKAST